MGSIVQKLIIAATIGAALAHHQHPATQPSDITSINNLRDKNGIENIILRVIKKISDKGALPADFPHQDYLRLLSAHRAISEDLGSVELSAEQTKINEFREGGDGEFGKKLIETEPNFANEKEAQSRFSTDYEKYYISPNEPFRDEDNVESQKSEPDKNEPEKSEQEKGEPEKIDDSTSKADVESTTRTGEIQPVTIPPLDVEEESKESQTEEPQVTVQPTSTTQPDTQTYPSAEEQQKNDFEGYNYEPVQSIQDSEKSGSSVITQFPSSANDNYITREGRKNDYQVDTPQRTETVEESVILQNSEEDQPDSNVLSAQTSNDEGNKPYVVEYNFVSSAGSKLGPTKPTPGSDIVVMGPTPIDIPDAQYEDENTTPLLLSFRRNISKAVEKENEDKKNKYENVRHTVEFAASPLVAAFTVEQDDKGIPRNIKPLDYEHSTAPPAPTEDPEIVARRQRELEEKEFILYQQLKSLQQEKSRYVSPQQQRQIMLQKKLEERKRPQPHFNNLNYYYHHSYQRNPEIVQQQQQPRQQIYQAPTEFLRYQEPQGQRLQLNRNNFQPSQGFEFHKSVDYSFPQYEHNRVHRREPTNQIGNFGYNNYPTTVSGQIQSLINTSGIGYGLPRNTQADLSVVSKILALNHGGFEPSSNVAYRRNQNSITYK